MKKKNNNHRKILNKPCVFNYLYKRGAQEKRLYFGERANNFFSVLRPHNVKLRRTVSEAKQFIWFLISCICICNGFNPKNALMLESKHLFYPKKKKTSYRNRKIEQNFKKLKIKSCTFVTLYAYIQLLKIFLRLSSGSHSIYGTHLGLSES